MESANRRLFELALAEMVPNESSLVPLADHLRSLIKVKEEQETAIREMIGLTLYANDFAICSTFGKDADTALDTSGLFY
ncbi:MAG: hypothetical protein CME26_08580 [Gemmatimonadetes bacterium]|nr:hypothetical protein [Gemmatimonadota bacterium]|tara:strand:+ start:289 stop:525 length:237 start_codon:yes stop_codon:yes gene_type:complete